MKYFKSFFFTIFILNLFTIFIFSNQPVYAETYTCKNGNICSGTFDSAQSPTPPFTNYCKDACPSGYQCTKYDSTTGCVDQTRTATTDNIPNLQIPDLNIKFSPKVCTTENGQTVCSIAWIGEYIAGIYKYAIGIVGILAAVVLMIGGVLWIVAGGSSTMIGEAKAWIGASLTGLVIALCSYLILFQINPALTIFGPLGIAQVKKIEAPIISPRLCRWEAFCQSGWEISDEKLCPKKETASETVCCCVKPIAVCQPTPSGPCAESNLQSYFGSNSYKASSICYKESSGNPLSESTSDKCNNDTNNPKRSFSIGLFQINLTVHKIDVNGYNLNCPSAFSAINYNCSIINETLYSACVAAAKDSNTNILKAKNISNNGGNWSAWSTNSICKF